MTLRLSLIGTLAALLLMSCAPTSVLNPNEGVAAEQVVRLPASSGRELEVRVWAASDPTVVVVFSSGGGGQPAAYERLMQALPQESFTVIAPVHSDALARGDLSGSGGPASFFSRLEDLAIARAYAEATYPGLPIVVMGHSFGSLMSALAVGASTPVGTQGDPGVKALVALSSPGIIPGLMTPDTYRTLSAPVLVVTGDRDVVPGMVADWRSHRALYDDSSVPGSALMIVPEADHNLVVNADDATFSALVELIATFVRAEALGDATARARLSKIEIGGATIERR